MEDNIFASINLGMKGFLNPGITEFIDLESAFHSPITISSRSDLARSLGIENLGTSEVMVTLDNTNKKIGSLRIETHNDGNRIFIDNKSNGNFHGNIRFLGRNNVAFFADALERYVALHDIFMRGNDQFLFWGKGSSAVGCSIEIEGTGQGVVVGDDALISSGVWIRNHDMHTVFDLKNRINVSPNPVTTVLERHVWLGQDALLIKCSKVGTGAIVGARALVRKPVPALTAVAGVPARVIREQVSWGRDANNITSMELHSIGMNG